MSSREFWLETERDLTALIEKIEKTRPRPSLEDLASRADFKWAREICRKALRRDAEQSAMAALLLALAFDGRFLDSPEFESAASTVRYDSMEDEAAELSTSDASRAGAAEPGDE